MEGGGKRGCAGSGEGGDPAWQVIPLAPIPTWGLAGSVWEEAVLTTPGSAALTIFTGVEEHKGYTVWNKTRAGKHWME